MGLILSPDAYAKYASRVGHSIDSRVTRDSARGIESRAQKDVDARLQAIARDITTVIADDCDITVEGDADRVAREMVALYALGPSRAKVLSDVALIVTGGTAGNIGADGFGSDIIAGAWRVVSAGISARARAKVERENLKRVRESILAKLSAEERQALGV